MKEIKTVNDIPGFTTKVPVYIDVPAKTKIYRSVVSKDDTFGFLIGDVLNYGEHTFVLISNIVTTVDEIDEKIDESNIVVGSFFRGKSMDKHLEELPSRLKKKEYYTLINAKVTEDRYNVEFEVYRCIKNNFSKVNYKKTTLPSGEGKTEEDIYIFRETIRLRETKKLVSFFIHSIFALIFGIVGGTVGALLSSEQPIQRRIFLLMIGVVGTLLWFGLPYMA